MSETKQFCSVTVHETSRPVAAPMSLKFALKQQIYVFTGAPDHLAFRLQLLPNGTHVC